MRQLPVLAAIGLILAVTRVQGSIVTFDDKAGFLTPTGAAKSADFDGIGTGNKGTSFSVGSLTFSSLNGYSLWVRDWTDRLDDESSDEAELAISGVENLDVNINLGGEVFSFGFEFVEPEDDPNLSGWDKHDPDDFVDSTFTVTLRSGNTPVDSFIFNAPNDQAAFVGVWSTSDQGFDNVQIRETDGGIGNEFFGEFYVGNQPIPEPASLAVWSLLGMGWAGACVWRRRRRRGT